MKNINSFIFLIIITIVTLGSCQRLGDFTIISTKNVSNQSSLVELKTNVEAKASDIETAIDKCLEQVDGGTYMTNTVIIQGIFRYKVKGDVWGVKK